MAFFLRFLILTLVLAGSGARLAHAAGWVNGAMQTSFHNYLHPINGWTYEMLSSQFVGFYGPSKVGEVYYLKITSANVSVYHSVYSRLEFLLPPNTYLAVSQQNKVMAQYENIETGAVNNVSSQVSQTPTTGAFGVMFNPTFSPYLWPLRPGEAITVYVPVVSTKEMSGIATNSYFVGAVQSISGTGDPWDDPKVGVFVAPNPPTVTYPNPSATEITATGAKTSASLFHHYKKGKAYFDLGTDTSYGFSSQPIDVSEEYDYYNNLWAQWNGLAGGTTYHWRMRFVDDKGMTYAGADQTFTTAALPTFSVSGKVTNTAGQAVSNVTLTLAQGASSATRTTGADGTYSFTGVLADAYTLTPQLAGRTFDPANRAVTVTTANLTNVDFQDTTTYTISGKVADGQGVGIAGIKLNRKATGGTTVLQSAVTGAAGDYSFTGVGPGSYVVEPAAAGFTFTPGNKPVSLPDEAGTGVDFTASLAAPTAPSPVTARATSSTGAEITFTDQSGNETGFRLYRAAGTAGPVLVKSVGASAGMGAVRTVADSRLTPDIVYTYTVEAFRTVSGVTVTAASQPVTVTPLPAPTTLTATSPLSNQVKLAWVDKSKTETGFKVERKTGTGAFAEVAGLRANVVAYTDSGVTANTTYTYRVKAYNAGGDSSYTNLREVTPLGAPGTLTAAAVNTTQVKLTWLDKSTGETGFRIERQLGTGAFTQVGTVGANAVTYTAGSLAANATYAFRVRAYSAAATSSYSNVRTSNTLAAPVALAATPVAPASATETTRKMTLTFWDKSAAEGGFKVERSLDGVTFTQGGTAPAAAGTDTVVTYTALGLAKNTRYYFRVRAYAAGTESGYSAVLNGTTAP